MDPTQINKKLVHWYTAQVRRVYDGDTFHVDIDLGLRIRLEYQRLRMARIDSPEIKGRSRTRGLAARDYLRSLIDKQEVMINTYQKGKYGRWIAEVYVHDYEHGWRNVSDMMMQAGHAKRLPD